MGWKGEDYTIPAEKVFQAVAIVEPIVIGTTSRPAIDILLKADIPMSRLAQAYGAVLRFAGAKVSDAEVYLNIQENIASGEPEKSLAFRDSCVALIAVISPPFADLLFSDNEGSAEDEKKV